MSIDVIVLALGWIITIAVLFFSIPINRIREALLIFFFKQLITWILGITVAQYGLIEYPVRSFPYATRASFDFEYFIYPAVCVVFNLHYPEGKSRFRQFMHYAITCTIVTVVEVLCEKHTNIINYIHWTWYITWLTLFITFFASRKFYVWFFRRHKKA